MNPWSCQQLQATSALVGQPNSFKVHMYNMESLMCVGLWFKQSKVRVKITTSGIGLLRFESCFCCLELSSLGQITTLRFMFTLYKMGIMEVHGL